MSFLKNRLNKLERKRGLEFDMDKPLHEWRRDELIAYKKYHDPNYKPPDYRGFSLEELKKLRDRM